MLSLRAEKPAISLPKQDGNLCGPQEIINEGIKSL